MCKLRILVNGSECANSDNACTANKRRKRFHHVCEIFGLRFLRGTDRTQNLTHNVSVFTQMDAEPVAANDAVAVNVEPAKPKQCACNASTVK